jgi:hypothetical protein
VRNPITGRQLKFEEGSREEIIRLIALVLAGLQVPRSIGPEVLGTAADPWDLLRERLQLYGWVTADDYEKCLHVRLGVEARSK